jgi:hypothetical protein
VVSSSFLNTICHTSYVLILRIIERVIWIKARKGIFSPLTKNIPKSSYLRFEPSDLVLSVKFCFMFKSPIGSFKTSLTLSPVSRTFFLVISQKDQIILFCIGVSYERKNARVSCLQPILLLVFLMMLYHQNIFDHIMQPCLRLVGLEPTKILERDSSMLQLC